MSGLKRQNPKGFTMLEVLVSMFVLTVAILALSKLQTVAVSTNYNTHRQTIATVLAQDKLEELMTLAWTDSQLTDVADNFANGEFDWDVTPDHTNQDGATGAANPIDENGVTISSPGPNDGYNRTWNVADSQPGSNMKTLAVRVQWQDKSAHSVIIETVISEE